MAAWIRILVKMAGRKKASAKAEPKKKPVQKAKAVEDVPVYEPKPDKYMVKAGKSISCKSGIKGPGEEIKESDINGGKEKLESLIESGHLEKK